MAIFFKKRIVYIFFLYSLKTTYNLNQALVILLKSSDICGRNAMRSFHRYSNGDCSASITFFFFFSLIPYTFSFKFLMKFCMSCLGWWWWQIRSCHRWWSNGGWGFTWRRQKWKSGRCRTNCRMHTHWRHFIWEASCRNLKWLLFLFFLFLSLPFLLLLWLLPRIGWLLSTSNLRCMASGFKSWVDTNYLCFQFYFVYPTFTGSII